MLLMPMRSRDKASFSGRFPVFLFSILACIGFPPVFERAYSRPASVFPSLSRLFQLVNSSSTKQSPLRILRSHKSENSFSATV